MRNKITKNILHFLQLVLTPNHDISKLMSLLEEIASQYPAWTHNHSKVWALSKKSRGQPFSVVNGYCTKKEGEWQFQVQDH